MDHQAWISKAIENLAAAQLCFDHGYFNACANRLYYAMFHAAVATLVKNGILPPSDEVGHYWVQNNFSGQLIHRRKIFSGKFKSYLSDIYWVRVRADYKTGFVSKKVASQELKKANEFINLINSELSHAT